MKISVAEHSSQAGAADSSLSAHDDVDEYDVYTTVSVGTKEPTTSKPNAKIRRSTRRDKRWSTIFDDCTRHRKLKSSPTDSSSATDSDGNKTRPRKRNVKKLSAPAENSTQAEGTDPRHTTCEAEKESVAVQDSEGTKTRQTKRNVKKTPATDGDSTRVGGTENPRAMRKVKKASVIVQGRTRKRRKERKAPTTGSPQEIKSSTKRRRIDTEDSVSCERPAKRRRKQLSPRKQKRSVPFKPRDQSGARKVSKQVVQKVSPVLNDTQQSSPKAPRYRTKDSGHGIPYSHHPESPLINDITPKPIDELPDQVPGPSGPGVRLRLPPPPPLGSTKGSRSPKKIIIYPIERRQPACESLWRTLFRRRRAYYRLV